MINAHKQALANHGCVSSSLKAMSAAIHEAEILLNAAVTAVDPEDPDGRKMTCLSDDRRVEAIGERRANTLFSAFKSFRIMTGLGVNRQNFPG